MIIFNEKVDSGITSRTTFFPSSRPSRFPVVLRDRYGAVLKTILVTDDDASTNGILCRLLTLAGYRAIAANNGEEALALLPAEHPDLVILDTMMQGIDGIEVLR